MVKILHWLKKFFSLFYDAIRNCWSQLWKSFVILVVLTVILATVFYIYEAPMQTEYGNWFKDLLWAFFFYIGDPGSFGGNGPVTFAGRVIASILSILNILIFAVPAGIIASGFTSALEAEAEEKKLSTYCAKIDKVFKPIQCRHTFIRVVKPYYSLATIQVKTGLTEEDIIKAVDYLDNDDLRLRNLADSYAQEDAVQDKLIVEHFPICSVKIDNDGKVVPLKKREYGCYIDRGSKITIVCPSSYDIGEIADSRFGYLLAEFGGFNFMSREFDLDSGSYYNAPAGSVMKGDDLVNEKVELSQPMKDFYADLYHLAKGEDKWVIFLLQVTRTIDSHISFVTRSKINGLEGLSVLPDQLSVLKRVEEETERMLANGGDLDEGGYRLSESEMEQSKADPLICDVDKCFRPIGPRNIATVLGAGKNTNAFTLRIAAKLLVRDRRAVPVALRLAEILRKNLVGKDTYIADNMPRWKKEDISYIQS